MNPLSIEEFFIDSCGSSRDDDFGELPRAVDPVHLDLEGPSCLSVLCDVERSLVKCLLLSRFRLLRKF